MKVLSEAERYIMSILWDANKPLTLFEIDEIVANRYWKKWQVQTIATFMMRLKDKGFVKYERIERHNRYEAIVDKESYQKMEIEDLVLIYFNNDINAFKSFVETME